MRIRSSNKGTIEKTRIYKGYLDVIQSAVTSMLLLRRFTATGVKCYKMTTGHFAEPDTRIDLVPAGSAIATTRLLTTAPVASARN